MTAPKHHVSVTTHGHKTGAELTAPTLFDEPGGAS